jgi:hypothetical protein
LSGERILRIDLKPSRGFAAVIVAVHCAAGACAGALVAGPAGVCLGLLIACLGVAAALDRALLIGKRSLRALRVEGKDRLTLELANAELVPLRVGARRFVSRFLVVLPGTVSMRRTIILAGDMLEPDSFRALRLWALWGQVPQSVPAQPTA